MKVAGTNSFESPQHVPRCHLRHILTILLPILLLTLFPYTFRFGAGPLDQGHLPWPTPVGPPPNDHGLDFLRNWLLFLPLGAVLICTISSRSLRCRHILLAGAGCLLVSGIIEALQIGLPSRTPAAADVLANTLGGLSGAFLVWWRPLLVGGLRRISGRLLRPFGSRRVLAVLLIAHLSVVALVVMMAKSRSSLANWSPDYPLLIGNEATGDRPWHGQLAALTLTANGQELLSMPDSSAGKPRLAGTRAMPLSWRGAVPGAGSQGRYLSVAPDAWLQSDGPATALVAALQESNAFDLRLTVCPADTLQRGPARIFSLSKDPAHRNLTVGQEGGALVVRLRTPFSGSNGTHPSLVVDDCFAPGQWTRLLVRYDGRRLVVLDVRGQELGRLELFCGAAVRHGPLRFNYDDQAGYCLVGYGFMGIPLLILLGVGRRRGAWF